MDDETNYLKKISNGRCIWENNQTIVHFKVYCLSIGNRN